MHLRPFLLLVLLTLAVSGCSDDEKTASAAAQPVNKELTTTVVASGLSQPIFVCSPPADNGRLFIVEKAGQIKILAAGSVLSTPFLDISSRVGSAGGEQGLLGLAFHPNYDSNGFLFVNYTALSGNTVVARFSSSPGANVADPSSEQIILTVNQPFSNHNAGMLAFGPNDDYLYIGLGDGGSAGDPQNNAQNPMTLLGKMLRIDVDSGLPYTIPADNPFVASSDTLHEIWAFGLRNPWRYSFDRVTGDLYIGDVGQNRIEEVSFSPATSTGGENYGWRLKEGTDCFNPLQDCEQGLSLTDPIHQYSHSEASSPCSITGGYVYRGSALPQLNGTYFFGDFCSGQIWSLRQTASGPVEFTERTAELDLSRIALASFGEDASGELYMIDFQGSVLKIVAAP